MHPVKAHVLIVEGKRTPYRSLRHAKRVAQEALKAWLVAYPEHKVVGTWPLKRVGPRTLEIVSVTGASARRVWAAYARQRPCPHCGDVAWIWTLCGAGIQRRACGTCCHPSYDCYCGREACDGR